MNTYLRIDINIIAAILLIIVQLLADQRFDKKDNFNHVFIIMSRMITILLLVEAATCVINKRPELWLIPITYILHIILFALAPFLSFHLFMLVKKLTCKLNKINMFDVVFFIPVMVHTIFVIISPFYHCIFYIDNQNIYHRGSLFLVFAMVTYMYFLLSLVYLLINRKQIIDSNYYVFLSLCILPVLGGLIQTMFYGVLLMWSSVAFSLIISFIFLQQRMLHIDYLTGAWDRGSFEYYMESRIKTYSDDKIGLIYVDIDELKSINDQYGHAEGDLAIKESIACIRRVIGKSDMIVRMGGDEFIIILDCELQEEIDLYISKIQESIALYNKMADKNYELSCSLGGAVYNPESSSIEDFLDNIDNLMYKNKELNKGKMNKDMKQNHALNKKCILNK